MEKQKINIFNWNHISDDLTEDQIDELKGYYASYHRKSWAYKQAMKHLKRMRFCRQFRFSDFWNWRYCCCCCYIRC